jgi:hypothetical protein
MSWRAITEDDIKTRISGSELETLRSAHLADGQADPIPSVISQITSRVRRACESAADIAMGAAGTIPEDLLSEALDLIVRELMKRPGYVADDALTKIRMEAAELADKALQRVAAGDETIEDADPSSTETTASFISEDSKTYPEDDELMT